MSFIITFRDSEFKQNTFDVHKTNCDGNDRITITCFDENNEITYSIWLDKSTAIRFAKTLRTEINKIQD
jgi:hypothetical protein